LWMVFLPAIFMTFVGGGVSSRLIARGWDIGKARKTVMLVFGLMMMASFGVGAVESDTMALVLSTTALMAFYGYSVNTLTLPADLVPPRLVASVSGLSGTGAGIGSVIFTFIVGYLADMQSFAPVFLLVGALPLASLAMLFLVMGRVKRVIAE
ncbi:MAG: MFS transporter, partial [bacterium]|nr:MFS transporter [bacterium]